MNRPIDPMEYPDLDTPMDVPQPESTQSSETGIVDEVSSAVSNAIESTSRYLQDQGLKDMAEDLKRVIQRNPIPALLVGIGLGFLIGRAMGPRI